MISKEEARTIAICIHDDIEGYIKSNKDRYDSFVSHVTQESCQDEKTSQMDTDAYRKE